MSFSAQLDTNDRRVAALARSGKTAHWVTVYLDRTSPLMVFVENAEEAAALAACLNDIQARRDAAREVAA